MPEIVNKDAPAVTIIVAQERAYRPAAIWWGYVPARWRPRLEGELRDLLRGVWAFVSLALAVLIFIGSGDQPPGGLDNFFVPEGGFVAHFLAYGALAFALVMAARPASWQGIAIVVTAAFLYGVANEIHQAFLAERHASVIDALVNLLGATLGATAGRLLIFVTRPH